MKHEFDCSVCDEHKTHESGIATGYGLDENGNKVCFECCGKKDSARLENMKIGEKYCLYLYKDEDGKWNVSNWPGTLKINVNTPRKGHHNMAGSRYDVWFQHKGNYFHGVQYGENTQICHIKRVALF